MESSLDHMIHELYDGQWISKSTAEHYLQILSIGNKAAREGDNSAYNANQAYHVLSQEIYSFTDADKAAPRPRRSQTQSRQAGSRKTALQGWAGTESCGYGKASCACGADRRSGAGDPAADAG